MGPTLEDPKPLADFAYDTPTACLAHLRHARSVPVEASSANIVAESVLVRQLVEPRLEPGVEALLHGRQRFVELIGTARAVRHAGRFEQPT